MSLLLAFGVAFAALASVSASEAAQLQEALAADGECEAGAATEACALHALQLRGKAASGAGADQSEEVEAAVDARAAAPSVAKWYLARQGDSCTQACKAQRLTCSQTELPKIRDYQSLFGAAQQAGAQCKYSWANDGNHGQGFFNAPEICTLAKCGIDAQGTCAYDKNSRATCDGQPATGFSRLCPCVSGSSSSSWWPSSHGSSASPAPSPVPGSSASGGVCAADTGGSCKYLGCASSRGKTVRCDKTSKKCLCTAGSCAQKGVCRKQTSTSASYGSSTYGGSPSSNSYGYSSYGPSPSFR